MALNTAPTGPDVDGPVASNGYNLIGETDGSSGWVSTDLTGTMNSPRNPMLAPLGDDGGPTETIALLAGSPAIDAGTKADDPGTTTPITTDERGFPLDSPTPDIGAFQTQPALVVNTTIDGTDSPSGKLSLRQAVQLANNLGIAETISFDATIFAKSQTIILTAGVLELENTGGLQTITGPTAGLTVSGGNTSEVFEVDSGVTATIAGLSITDGSSDSDGGGINNAGTLTITHCTLNDNYGLFGGGIWSTGTVTVISSALTDNSAGDGAGINVASGTLALSNSTLTGNSAVDGGGIDCSGMVTVNSSTFTGNSANGYGGGLDVDELGTLAVTDSILSNNSASYGGGGVFSTGTVTVTSTILTDNSAGSGGGIYVARGTLTLSSSTLTGNTAASTPPGPSGSSAQFNGGGIYNAAILTVTDSTLSDNSTVLGDGGGIDNSGTLAVTNSTLSGNSAVLGGGIGNLGSGAVVTVSSSTLATNSATSSGGGIYSADNNTVTFLNTIVATDAAPTGPDIDGTVISSGHNLVGNKSGANFSVMKTDIIGVDPDLGLLQGNGGPTETMALLPGSPAIQEGATADFAGTTTPITTDQRGFPLDSPSPDIGAFQFQNGPRLVVNTTVDGTGSPFGDLSLRQAVNLADQLGPTETITFDSTVFNEPQTITLLAGPLELSNTGGQQTVTGPAAGVTVSGGGNSGVFQIDSGVTASIAGLSIIDGNSANGGGILDKGNLTVTDCNLSGNSAALGNGGGIDNLGTLALNDSAVFGNSASYGGGIFSYRPLTVSNSTISGNTALYGGGIANYATLTVTSSTLASNAASYDGGGIFSYSGSAITMTFADTIVALDTGPLGPDVYGTVTSDGYNLIGETDGSTGWLASTDLTGTMAQPLDPRLAPLGDYGGPTETMALRTGSPAIAARTGAGGITTDQRGFALDSPSPDIGAFQTQPGLVVNTTTDGIVSPSGDLSLRQAVDLANGLGAAETIVFDSTIFIKKQTITLIEGVLELTNTGRPETITGSAAGVTVSGGGNSGVFLVDTGVSATIAGLNIADGNSTVGGGIDNAGTLTITDCTLSGNSATATTYAGGGIDNTGTLTVTSSTLSGNSATVGDGGAILDAGTLTITDSTLSANSANAGAGIFVTGTAAVTGSTLSGNSAQYGGAIDNLGKLTINGGAIIEGNQASQGGGIRDRKGTLTIIDSSVMGNKATANGGGIDVFGGA